MEAARRYDLPKTLSPSTSSIIDQHRYNLLHSNGQHQEAIPEANDLLSIKADLESLLPSAERRTKDLKYGLNTIDHKSREMLEPTSGKSVNAMIERMRIKQELDDDTLQNNSLSRNELSRQAALEQIKKKRRRESTDDAITRRSESPHLVKLKKLEGMPSLVSRSESPPTSKPPKLNHDLKKAKKSTARSQQLPSSSETEDIDFVRVKPKDQVQITTFWTALEPYFRNLTEEDRQILLQKSDQGKPYLIPPLGQHYLEKWAEEDQQTMQEVELLQPQLQQHKLKYLQSQQALTDQHLLYDDLGCGTLTERLISSLVAEDLITEESLHGDESDLEEDNAMENHTTEYKRYNSKAMLLSEPPEEIVGFEERLKRELQYAGLFNDDDADWNAREDDEICAELRTLGREFKEQVKMNEYRKKRLLEVVECQLQYEQYRQVLDTLDSQVEQGYIKRFRPQKSKKRKTNGPKATLSENTLYAMEKRKTWIGALGGIFKDKNMTMPKTSIYEEHANDIYGS
ncbi:histone acetyltransferases subunit 3-domain-containing protein [Blakeslea trispora]|nr:histone acetyltransferases subunit 3-domain-containing protein [Blakeslea trispora]